MPERRRGEEDGRETRPHAKKSFGQNFLVHRGTIETIVRLADIQPGETVVELGPGLGAITGHLAEKAGHVVAVELDERLVAWLMVPGRLPGNVEILHGDMLSVSFADLAGRFGGRLKVLGNLPYNISSQMVFRLVSEREWISEAVLMFQKEVADRLLARPGSKDYGILTVNAGAFSDMGRLLNIPPGFFRPVPKVTSTLVRFRFREPVPSIADHTMFVRVVRAAFQKRRKKLSNALGDLGETPRISIENALSACGISGDDRAEDVDIPGFICLSNELSGQGGAQDGRSR